MISEIRKRFLVWNLFTKEEVRNRKEVRNKKSSTYRISFKEDFTGTSHTTEEVTVLFIDSSDQLLKRLQPS